MNALKAMRLSATTLRALAGRHPQGSPMRSELMAQSAILEDALDAFARLDSAATAALSYEGQMYMDELRAALRATNDVREVRA